MLGGLGEAGGTLGQWDGTGPCNSLLMSGSRLMSNQGLLMGHKSGRTCRAFVSPVCPLYLWLQLLSKPARTGPSSCFPPSPRAGISTLLLPQGAGSKH